MKILIVALITMLLLACEGSSSPVQELTVVQIADNHARFNSVVNNAPDIKTGKFTLFPWFGDTFVLKSDILPEIQQETKTTKEISEDDRTVSVETKTTYWFEETPVGPATTRYVMVEWDKKEVPVSVNIQVVAANAKRQLLDKTVADAVKNLPKGTHAWKVIASVYLYKAPYYDGERDYARALPKYLDNYHSPLNELKLMVGDIRYLHIVLHYVKKKRWEQEQYKEQERILAENAGYQTLRAKKYSERSQEDYERINVIRSEAEEQASKKIGYFGEYPFDPGNALQEIVFVFPVIVESIDGINMITNQP